MAIKKQPAESLGSPAGDDAMHELKPLEPARPPVTANEILPPPTPEPAIEDLTPKERIKRYQDLIDHEKVAVKEELKTHLKNAVAVIETLRGLGEKGILSGFADFVAVIEAELKPQGDLPLGDKPATKSPKKPATKTAKGAGTVNADLKKPLIALLTKDKGQSPAGLTDRLKSEKGTTAQKEDVQATLKQLVLDGEATFERPQWYKKA